MEKKVRDRKLRDIKFEKFEGPPNPMADKPHESKPEVDNDPSPTRHRVVLSLDVGLGYEETQKFIWGLVKLGFANPAVKDHKAKFPGFNFKKIQHIREAK